MKLAELEALKMQYPDWWERFKHVPLQVAFEKLQEQQQWDKPFDAAQREQVLVDLYDSEINYAMTTFWDGGLSIKLGDESNGFRDEMCFAYPTHQQDWVRGIEWLKKAAMKHYPDSDFAKKYRKD